MKTCSACKEEKPISEFYAQKDRKSGIQSYCKSCFNKFCMERWKQRKKKAIEYKGSKCEDCSISFLNMPSCIFDFHHLDPLQKDMDWQKLRQCSWNKIVKELDKCILLCSNCHRVRHSD